VDNVFKKRRSVLVALLMAFLIILGFSPSVDSPSVTELSGTLDVDVLSDSVQKYDGELASNVLSRIDIKGRASKTGYSRDEFGSGWASIDGCDTRNIILGESLINAEVSEDDCTVLNGTLNDPYTGVVIEFTRGRSSSSDVQIDHVVALSDAWQKGAQQLDETQRLLYANDPLNLLAVDGPANQQKGDSDAASWLPPYKNYRCRYVARQIAVKREYSLWVSAAEKAAMKRILNGCGEQRLPVEEFITD
jgi:hypothetical protein